MTSHTLPPISYNPDEDWLRPILGALLVHLLVVLIFGLAWLWSPTRNTSVAAGEGTLEASLELSGAEMAAAQRALNQSIAQSSNAPVQTAPPSRQALPPPTVEPTLPPEVVVPVIIPDTREQMRVLAEQQRQQQQEAERQRQAELVAEQQRQQQEEAERQRQVELVAEQQRQQQEEAERQRQAELLAEQQRQQAEAEAVQRAEQEQQEAAERQQRLAQAAELRQRREQLEQQAAQEQQRLARMQNEQRRAQQAAAAASPSSSGANNAGAGHGSSAGSIGASGDNNELVGRYKAAIQQAVRSQWNRPENVAIGQTCSLTIHQIPGGQVIDVQFSADCSYDQAGRDSVERAILRASPLPYYGFESVSKRTLKFTFEAQDR